MSEENKEATKQKAAVIKWEKPNGNKIETNDLPATVAYCESLDWKRLSK